VRCFFVTDLHGRPARYRALFERIAVERPEAVFLGGDLLPTHLGGQWEQELGTDDFVRGYLKVEFSTLRETLGAAYPRVFLILGNDDLRIEEGAFREIGESGLWSYMHERREELGPFPVYGYACVPPTPFLLKDWERYDVSRHVDPGSVSPEEGRRSVAVDEHEMRYGTIREDLIRLTGTHDLSRAILLFHAPPYQSKLDRAALDGKRVEGVPLDLHIGSVAVRRFIQERQPWITLHGHVHESTRLTGEWRDRIGRTHLFSAAHDGPELALVRFDAERPQEAEREVAALPDA
jgi:Icc-related predicted phosphoesterase